MQPGAVDQQTMSEQGHLQAPLTRFSPVKDTDPARYYNPVSVTKSVHFPEQ